ncbi:hypothetical protein [Actinomadura madurae]|uniref:hypothetical protein n=1 Tax=Actinomadura madurae TaxID=1993 RepID=UPI002025D1CB|nr:hypothetical protein [Actinomadura madurae]MCP9954476.1 hypothetical protein [Actinomadura madurae]MCP9971223.1 hypothetical protein [Actinomadura madurae]MCP9983707.1 hypothetical protein [Actinomadura madurae]MCQ0004725.1 hypothetical protein [Actinomadura madurae]MCQ0019948.1 hypothetical protein [Actinomadura madurae]
MFYVWTACLPTYASLTVDLAPKLGLTSGAIALTWFPLLQPILGVVSDRAGRRPILRVFGVFFAVATVPMLSPLDGTSRSMLAVQLKRGRRRALPRPVPQCRDRPALHRVRGAVRRNRPYVVTWLVDQGRATWFPWYIALGSTLVHLALPETARRPLR